jgi:superfamily I DNA/RNA helicase
MEETGALPMWDALPRAEAELEDPDTLDRFRRKHVIVDEAQDVTIREERVARMVGEHVAAVGDPRQAIMGFRGAVGMCGSVVYAGGHVVECLPLSRSFRFGPNIAAFATTLCGGNRKPTWGSAEIDDAVRLGATDDDAVAALKPRPAGAAVLCRTHDECELAARRLSNLGLRVHYAGRREPGEDRPDPFAEAVSLDAAAVSTIHGAKGREFDAVYVPTSEIGPRQGGDDPQCAYVAATRARRLLLWGDVRWAMR